MSEHTYQPQQIEQQAQAYWAANETFKVSVDHSKEKFYSLVMFPYPSGDLHIGHVRNYTIGDVIARYQRMKGKNVLNPFGWDSFGMPAENAANQHKTSPAKWTYKNIDNMREQVKRLGCSYDWSRELTTCTPDYYRWEQQFFTKLYQKGVVYRKKSAVNWCEVDQTVLANEQVVDGCCWRCDTPVVQKELDQWFIRISDYAQELLDSLETMDQWPERVRQMQRNWIGRSEGVEISFDLVEEVPAELAKLKVFTTRPDTFMGVTYAAVAAGHPLAEHVAQTNPEVAQFIAQCKAVKTSEADLSTMEKLAFPLGLHVKHPLTGKNVPLIIANFVLMTYGTGAVMAVPAHDERDYEVAKKYHLPLQQVIAPASDDVVCDLDKAAFTDAGVLVNSGEFDGLTSEQAYKAIGNKLVELGRGEFRVNFRLRDWGVSRQRYWGCPIPMVRLPDGKIVAVEDKDLPVVLPEYPEFTGTNPLVTDTDYQTTTWKGQPAVRETDTFDTFMESSWYYARYTCPDYQGGMLNKEEADYWLPVDNYVGGIEHAILHLLYSRFFHKLMRDEGLVSCDEPFKKYVPLGMVLANAFYYLNEEGQRVWLNQKHVNVETDERGQITGGTAKEGGHKCVYAGMVKMSKSKNNGVSPTEMLNQYGADALRVYMMFAAPIEATLEWSESALEGSVRFTRRIWNLAHDVLEASKDLNDFSFTQAELDSRQKTLRRALHNTIAKVSDDIERRQAFNTAIAAIMELLNTLTKYELQNQLDVKLMREAVRSLVLMLYPLTPHLGFALWQKLGETAEIDFYDFPQADPEAMVADSKLIVVQVNGKLRAKLELPAGASEEEVKAAAFADEKVTSFFDGKEPAKVIYVKDKLLNIVVK